MSRVEVGELVRASPLRARSLLTVRAAISSARDSERPCSSSLSLTCSYWRARLLPGLTPRGGMGTPFLAGFPDARSGNHHLRVASLRDSASSSEELAAQRNPKTWRLPNDRGYARRAARQVPGRCAFDRRAG